MRRMRVVQRFPAGPGAPLPGARGLWMRRCILSLFALCGLPVALSVLAPVAALPLAPEGCPCCDIACARRSTSAIFAGSVLSLMPSSGAFCADAAPAKANNDMHTSNDFFMISLFFVFDSELMDKLCEAPVPIVWQTAVAIVDEPQFPSSKPAYYFISTDNASLCSKC